MRRRGGEALRVRRRRRAGARRRRHAVVPIRHAAVPISHGFAEIALAPAPAPSLPRFLRA